MVSSTCLVVLHHDLVASCCVDLLHGYIDKLFSMPYNYISHIGCQVLLVTCFMNEEISFSHGLIIALVTLVVNCSCIWYNCLNTRQ